MDYPGKELEIFSKAKIFQKYIHFIIKNFLRSNILEVGAGIGSFASNYLDYYRDIYLSELDPKNFEILKNKFIKNSNIKISNKKIDQINLNFNTIIYVNVLEHIPKDKEEIELALSKLNLGGHLVILVPAHQNLYGRFDKAIGHCRRYDIGFFSSNNYKNAKIKKLIYLDGLGYILYFFNKILFKEEVYPSKIKIFVWDKIFTPITIIFDYITRYKFGKNILCIYEKVK